MSLDNLSIDFSRLSFDLPDVNNGRLVAQPTPSKLHQDSTPGAKSRNRQCIPSDDEDEEEEEEDEEEGDDSDDEGREPRAALRSNQKATGRKIKKQLPSDDEEDEEDERGVLQNRVNYYNEEVGYYNEGGAHVMYGYDQGYNSMQQPYYEDDDDDDRALVPNPNAGPVLTLVEGSHLQQLQKKQQQHQAQLAQFQYLQTHPNQHNANRYPYHHQHHQKPMYQHQNKSMSGMDLLKQLEQEKADLKRIKPKLDTSQVKMQGLLGNIPEPGSHNISFQQIQQQQKRQHKTRPSSAIAASGYLDPNSHRRHYRSKSPSRSPSPHARAPSPGFTEGNHYRNSHINK